MNDTAAAYPCGFYCEHTPSKSRVYALISHAGGPSALCAVLTVNDPDLAERICRALEGALNAVPGPVLRDEIEQIRQLLPAAPAASLAQTLGQLAARAWPSPVTPLWPDIDGQDEARDIPHRLADGFARTPHAARLAQHPGPVVRIGHLIEVHVHDAERLLLAADAAGLSSGGGGEAGDDVEDRLLDAVMYLADRLGPIPGTDQITMDSIGYQLTPGDDEVADWSGEPVQFDFGSGYLNKHEERTDRWGAPARVRPDYEALFPIPACEHDEGDYDGCEECEAFILTPRSVAVLSAALASLADWARTDVNEHGEKAVEPDSGWCLFDQLPRITWRQDSAWRRRFAQAADHLAADLDHGRAPRPTCTAEEMALHLAFEEADAVRDQAANDEEHAQVLLGGLPEHSQDYDWDLCADLCLQDSDVLFLYDDAADGLEDPETEINQAFRIGDLRVGHWFDTFANMPAREPAGAE